MAKIKIVSRPHDVLHMRVAANVAVTASGCWEANAFKHGNGYARTYIRGKPTYLHRAAYAEANGPIAPGLQIDHLCRNRACCNPAHLDAVTPKVNNNRSPLVKFNSGNLLKTHCKRGHEFSAENTFLHSGQRLCRTCRRAAAKRFLSKELA